MLSGITIISTGYFDNTNDYYLKKKLEGSTFLCKQKTGDVSPPQQLEG